MCFGGRLRHLILSGQLDIALPGQITTATAVHPLPQTPLLPDNEIDDVDDDSSNISDSNDSRLAATTQGASSQRQRPLQTQSRARKPSNKRSRLDPEARIFVVRCCVRDAELYSKLSRKAF